MPSKNGMTRLYHSNVNLPRSVTQYEISKNLGKSLENLPKSKTTLLEKKKSIMQDDKGERLSLLLPHIEPDCDINLDVNARDASATIMSPSLSGDDVMRNAAKTSNEKLDNFDYLTNFDDDNETAKNKLYKVGQYEMEHNWILHEGLQKNLENFDKEGKKLQISIPDNKSKAPITDRIQEVKSMLKPRAELGDFINNMDPAQKERIKVRNSLYSLVKQELPTLPEHLSSPPDFSGVRVTQSFVFYVMFCRSLFVLLSFFFWPLCCVSFFDLRILIKPLVYSDSSYAELYCWKVILYC